MAQSVCDVASRLITRKPPGKVVLIRPPRVGADHSRPPRRIPAPEGSSGCGDAAGHAARTRDTPLDLVRAAPPPNRRPPPPTPSTQEVLQFGAHPAPSWSHETCVRTYPKRSPAHSFASTGPRRDSPPSQPRVPIPTPAVSVVLFPIPSHDEPPSTPPRSTRRFLCLLAHAPPPPPPPPPPR